MTTQQLETTSHRNARLVPVEPQVKSAKTREMSLRGVSANAGSAKSADPSCYASPVAQTSDPAVEAAGLFENRRRMKMDDISASIRKYFTVETAPRQPSKWLVICEKCDSMWHLDKSSNHPGNVLHLLNHARGHDEKKPRKAGRSA